MRPTASRTRRRAACIAGVVSLLAVSACGTGFDAQTNQVYQPAAGANERAESVDLLNVLAADNSDDTATISASLLNKGDADDTVTAITGTTDSGDGLKGGDPIDVQLAGPIALPTHELVKVGADAEIVVSYDDLGGGQYVTLDFEFENAAPITMDVPVVARGEHGIYDGIAEAPEPTTEPTTDEETKPDGQG
ncbi:hypothetical protein [Solicola gregarius]|uniref:Copper chaperone PCu(A)C n=1 Tax=Solicola gregarius TaxID=2908642 RepID=A0AA46YMQ3_9ACTN|nr:hypothetical protein [Solicola gregarius]UYM06854.1 hypothetical protein L0C25_07200 [Solicola gregarius]